MKTMKVLDINCFVHLVCVKHIGTVNPYRLYAVIYEKDKTGYYTVPHKKQIAKYGDIESVLCMIKDLFMSGIQHKTDPELLSWCKQYYGS